jgi:histone deacetylase complex subunit SAP18
MNETEIEMNYEEEANFNSKIETIKRDFDDKIEMEIDEPLKNPFSSPSTTNGVDRRKTCPFMVKMYCRINGHHRLEEFSPPRFPVEDEMIVYTWRDATLKELSTLVREVLGDNDLPGGIKGTDPALKFSFNLLYPDSKRSGILFRTKLMGWAFEGGEPEARAHQLEDSSEKTLESLKFQPGDFIDVAIYTNPAMIPKQINNNNSYSNTNRNNFGRKILYGNKRF